MSKIESSEDARFRMFRPLGMTGTPPLPRAAAPSLPSFVRRQLVIERRTVGNQVVVDERSARLAANEAVFRAGNELIGKATRGLSDRTEFLCECGDPHCFRRVELSAEEYEAVRSHPARFLVVPGHEDLTAGEVVVEERGQWTVVEKRGGEREIVERSNPRAS
jgi:hypothetical protein